MKLAHARKTRSGKRRFRGGNVAAPLKHTTITERFHALQGFRGGNVAAPLKRPIAMQEPCDDESFRGGNVAAPLKPVADRIFYAGTIVSAAATSRLR